MNKGIIPINKPSEWTSFDVCNKIKHTLRQIYGKNMPKVGHLGTLDPMATGVLLVTVGKATKLFDIMQEKQKTYVAKFEFGKLTDTLDVTGNLLATSSVIPIKQQTEQVLPEFIGEIAQIPPKYSAKSVNGKRAYDLARNNIEFELKPSIVKIFNIELISYENNILTLQITCGSGTYIRAIGRDIAEKLSTYAVMTELVRTQIGNFNVNSCEQPENLTTENIQNSIIKIKDVLNLPEIKLTSVEEQKILNGQTLKTNLPDGIYALNDQFDTVALIKICNFSAKMSLFLG